jgi:hypothetical protein
MRNREFLVRNDEHQSLLVGTIALDRRRNSGHLMEGPGGVGSSVRGSSRWFGDSNRKLE